jgi:hypothetical protein
VDSYRHQVLIAALDELPQPTSSRFSRPTDMSEASFDTLTAKPLIILALLLLESGAVVRDHAFEALRLVRPR